MNASSFTQAVVVLAVSVIAVSCSTTNNTRSYPEDRPVVIVNRDPTRLPPGHAKKIYGRQHYPLIIVRGPSIVISRFNDGRYYYRNPAGYYYWKGYDDRYYLDENYLSRVYYEDRDYRDWQYKGKYKDHKKYRGHGKHKHKGRDRDRDDD